jgi:Flp pilus assembly protein TadD
MSHALRVGLPVALVMGLAACATGGDGAPRAGAGLGANGQRLSAPSAVEPTAAINADARATAARQDPLSQMAFWAREVEAHPQDVVAHRALSEALRLAGRNDRCIQVSRDALRQFQDDPALSRSLGLALLSTGRAQDALRPLAVAAGNDGQDYRTRSSIGVAFDQLGRSDQARMAYQEALAIRPDDPVTLTNLGVSYLLTGDAEQAEQVLRQASALPNAPAEARQNLAIALGLLGRVEEAEQLARVDLPPVMAAANAAYLRGLFQDERRWGDLRESLQN